MIPEVVKFVEVVVGGLMLFFIPASLYKGAGFNPAWAIIIFIPVFGVLLMFLQLAYASAKNNKY